VVASARAVSNTWVRANPPGSPASVTIAQEDPRSSRHSPQIAAMLQPSPVKRQ
jgi:hypothetical protein